MSREIGSSILSTKSRASSQSARIRNQEEEVIRSSMLYHFFSLFWFNITLLCSTYCCSANAERHFYLGNYNVLVSNARKKNKRNNSLFFAHNNFSRVTKCGLTFFLDFLHLQFANRWGQNWEEEERRNRYLY